MRRRRAMAMVVLIFAAFMDLLDVTIVNVALPSIRDNLGVSSATLEWIPSGYTLLFAVLLITGGRLGDAFGRRTIFFIGVTGFTLSSFAATMAMSGAMLIAARIVQGAFAALMAPQVVATIQVLYRPHERAAILGLVSAVGGSAAIIGPLLGGWLVGADTLGIGWRSVFLINIPIGVALAAATLIFVPNSRSSHRVRFDISGAIALTLALSTLVIPLITLVQYAPLMFAASVVFALFFIWTQIRAASPLVPVFLFRDRSFRVGCVIGILVQVFLVGFFFIFMMYLQDASGMTPEQSALSVLPLGLAGIVGCGLAVPLAARFGRYLMMIGPAFVAIGLVWLRVIVVSRFSYLTVESMIGPMIIAGIGVGLASVPLVDLTVKTVDVNSAGATAGVFNTFQQVGAVLGNVVIGGVFFAAQPDGRVTHLGLHHGFLNATFVCLVGFIVAGILAVGFPRQCISEPLPSH